MVLIKNFKEFQNLYESIGSIDPSKFFTPQQIVWCDKHIEGKWSVNTKGEVTVTGDIKFKDKTFTRFEVQFADTKDDFYCNDCTNLTSLQGAPQKVKYFYCGNCTNLTSLQGAPQEVDYFYCNDCTSLTTLEGAPQKEVLTFNCSGCTSLTTLQGAPQKAFTFNCSGCTSLTTLQGAPQKAFTFSCKGCTNLTSLQGAPQEVKHFHYDDCLNIDPEEVNLLKEDPELFKKWLASGTSFKEWKEKKRGMIIGKKYGL